MKDIRDGDDDGEVNLAAVLYHSNFRGSDRSQVGPVSVRRGSTIPQRMLPDALTVCSAAGEPPMVTVQGWEDDAGGLDGALDFTEAIPVGPSIPDILEQMSRVREGDDVLAGVTLPITGAGTRSASSSDLTVDFRAEHSTVQPDPCETAKPTEQSVR